MCRTRQVLWTGCVRCSAREEQLLRQCLEGAPNTLSHVIVFWDFWPGQAIVITAIFLFENRIPWNSVRQRYPSFHVSSIIFHKSTTIKFRVSAFLKCCFYTTDLVGRSNSQVRVHCICNNVPLSPCTQDISGEG